jgi:hypothetical protein
MIVTNPDIEKNKTEKNSLLKIADLPSSADAAII